MTAVAAQASLTDQDIATLQGLLADWVRYCLDQDWDALATLLADDVVFLPPEQPLVQGRSSVRAWLDTFPPINAFNATLEQADGRADLAWTRGAFEMSIEPNPGIKVALKGKWAATWRKGADGKWLCTSDVWNTDHPVPAA